ncbi:hypothetical protein ACPPVQ_19145 [Diaminobutyricibacter sp. McL0618]|uniref:hypothetical protein n=1 Tax=Leifsonia sp. McL0618 TaxID=3415677 RepID=UPI003CEF6148
MAGNQGHLRQLVHAAICVVALGALAGCATIAAAQPHAERTSTPTPTALAVTVPMPDLGPSPAPAPQTAAETEQRRLSNADQAWKQLSQQYPSAVRPAVTFGGYITDSTEVAVMSQCYTEQGVPIANAYPPGAKKGDPPSSVGADASDQKEAVGAWVCSVEHPYQPSPPPTPQQLGYLYDYLTEFLVPCYEANGISEVPAPSRAEFIAKWPNQNWFPSDGAGMDGAKAAAISKACPPAK